MAAEAEDSRRTLIRFIEQLQSAYGIAGRDTIIAGFGVLAGRILPELQPHIAPRDRLAALNAFIGHGKFDSKLPATWAQRAGQWLDDLGVSHVTRLYPGDHALSEAMRDDFLEWVHARIKAR